MSQAVPHLTYGLNTVKLCKTEIDNLSFAYNSVFFKLFKTNDVNVINNCQFYSGYLSFSILYDYHRLQFLQKLFDTKFVTERSSVDLHDYLDLNALRVKYRVQHVANKQLFFKYFFDSLI